MGSNAHRRRKKKTKQSRKCEHVFSEIDLRSGPTKCNICSTARGVTQRLNAVSIDPVSENKRKRGASDVALASRKASKLEFNNSQDTNQSQTPNDFPPHTSAKVCQASTPTPSSGRSIETRLKTHLVVQRKSSDECGICTNIPERHAWKRKMGGETISWLRCEMKTCKLWYHASCIFYLLHQDPQSMLFCPGPSRNRAMIICPECIDQPENGYDNAIQQAMKMFISTFEKEKRKEIEKRSSVACSTPLLSVLDEIDFEPVREEKYNGYDDGLVESLVRNLHHCVLDYHIEIQDAMDRSTPLADPPRNRPLAEWDGVDPHCSVVAGNLWFDADTVRSKRHTRHAHITAALRAMLGIPANDPLRIASEVYSITYSQVHTGIVSWFVFDIIDNQIDIHRLPNMKSTRSMMTAVASAGEARWPRQGRQLLQEVQLRTWYKSEFQQTLLSNVDTFKRYLEAFMKPLTKDFDHYSQCHASRRSLIEATFRLWSYLKSLQGRLVIIQPAIQATFDAKLHEAYDREGIELDLGQASRRKILWILCRGFQYVEDDGIDSPRTFTIKAQVVVQ